MRIRFATLAQLARVSASITSCRKPLTVTAKPTSVVGDKLSIDVTTSPKAKVGCEMKVISAKCDPTMADPSGHAKLTIEGATELRADVPVSIWADSFGKRVTTPLDLKSTPLLATSGQIFRVLGSDCGGVLRPHEVPALLVAPCTATITSGAPAPIAKTPLSFLVSPTDAQHSVGIEVQAVPGTKLAGTLQYSDASLRSEIMSALQGGKPIAGDDKEHPAHAVLLVGGVSEPPRVIGDTGASIGGLRYVATVTLKRRPSPTPCVYKSKDTGRTVSGTAYFGDADVKVVDRHSQKQSAETTIAATGDPCDSTQKLSTDAKEADTSGAFYKEADVEKWLMHFLSTAKP